MAWTRSYLLAFNLMCILLGVAGFGLPICAVIQGLHPLLLLYVVSATGLYYLYLGVVGCFAESATRWASIAEPDSQQSAWRRWVAYEIGLSLLLALQATLVLLHFTARWIVDRWVGSLQDSQTLLASQGASVFDTVNGSVQANPLAYECAAGVAVALGVGAGLCLLYGHAGLVNPAFDEAAFVEEQAALARRQRAEREAERRRAAAADNARRRAMNQPLLPPVGGDELDEEDPDLVHALQASLRAGAAAAAAAAVPAPAAVSASAAAAAGAGATPRSVSRSLGGGDDRLLGADDERAAAAAAAAALCTICMVNRRDAFNSPCGHSFLCWPCAQQFVRHSGAVCNSCYRPSQLYRVVHAPPAAAAAGAAAGAGLAAPRAARSVSGGSRASSGASGPFGRGSRASSSASIAAAAAAAASGASSGAPTPAPAAAAAGPGGSINADPSADYKLSAVAAAAAAAAAAAGAAAGAISPPPPYEPPGYQPPSPAPPLANLAGGSGIVIHPAPARRLSVDVAARLGGDDPRVIASGGPLSPAAAAVADAVATPPAHLLSPHGRRAASASPTPSTADDVPLAPGGFGSPALLPAVAQQQQRGAVAGPPGGAAVAGGASAGAGAVPSVLDLGAAAASPKPARD